MLYLWTSFVCCMPEQGLMTETLHFKNIKEVQVVHKILYLSQCKVFEYITDVEMGTYVNQIILCQY